MSSKNREAERWASDLAKRTGELPGEVVIGDQRERLARQGGRQTAPRLRDQLLAIGRRCAALPDLDARSADAIRGYSELGLPR